MTLETRDIDGQMAERRNNGGGGAFINSASNDGGFRRLIDGLLVVGVASLIAVVWNLSNTVSVLTTQVTFITQELTQLRAKMP